jgi:hypothetical protein
MVKPIIICPIVLIEFIAFLDREFLICRLLPVAHLFNADEKAECRRPQPLSSTEASVSLRVSCLHVQEVQAKVKRSSP